MHQLDLFFDISTEYRLYRDTYGTEGVSPNYTEHLEKLMNV